MNMGGFDSFHFDEWDERYEKSSIGGIWKNSKQKKTLKFHLKLNFYNFQERKNGKVLG